MTIPFCVTGSLCPDFSPVRLVGLSVKHPCIITLCCRLPIDMRVPLEASVTLLEATTPVKLPTTHCPLLRELVLKCHKGRISPATPHILTNTTLSLRPILHI